MTLKPSEKTLKSTRTHLTPWSKTHLNPTSFRVRPKTKLGLQSNPTGWFINRNAYVLLGSSAVLFDFLLHCDFCNGIPFWFVLNYIFLWILEMWPMTCKKTRLTLTCTPLTPPPKIGHKTSMVKIHPLPSDKLGHMNSEAGGSGRSSCEHVKLCIYFLHNWVTSVF